MENEVYITILQKDYPSDEQFENSEKSKHCESDLLTGVVNGTIPEEPPLSEVSRQKYSTRMEAVAYRHPIKKGSSCHQEVKYYEAYKNDKTILKMNTKLDSGGERWRIKSMF